MNVRSWLCGLLLLMAAPLGADEQPLTIAVSPVFSFAPANLMLRARIATYKDNRLVVFTVDSENYYRRSDVLLDGENAPLQTILTYRDLPTGSYEVRAILFGYDGRERAVVASRVEVESAGS